MGISLHSITKAFPGVVANDHVSMVIEDGTVHCLLGENGAGKSTLVSILAGLQQPDSGHIRVDGVETRIGSPRVAANLGIGVVHQHSTLIPSFTVLENLLLGERGLRLDRTQGLARLEELSELLGANIDPNARTSELGLGQQQQVEIAKALWKGGRLLILDEPTSMLTPQAIEHLAASIEGLKAQGLAVVLVTHKLREAFAMGDCVTVLRGGRNAAHISEAELSAMTEGEAQRRILEAMFGGDLAELQGQASAAELAGAAEPARDVAKLGLTTRPARLVLQGVSTKGRGGDTDIAEVSLTVREGEILGVAGIDGHGQAALAEAVAGQRAISSGRILLEGQDIGGLGVRSRRKLGVRYVTDDRLHEGTVGSLSVALNLVLKRIGERPFWRFGQINQRAIADAARAQIAEYGIRTPSPETRVGTLSGGNIQKILLARELEGDARLVVVNKPTSGLDLKTVRRVRSALRDFADGGGSVLLLSTELDELIELSHRITVLSRGRTVGTVENDGTGVAERVGTYMAGAVAGEPR